MGLNEEQTYNSGVLSIASCLSKSYGSEAPEKMGVLEAKVFKTLVVVLDNKELAVGVVFLKIIDTFF